MVFYGNLLIFEGATLPRPQKSNPHFTVLRELGAALRTAPNSLNFLVSRHSVQVHVFLITKAPCAQTRTKNNFESVAKQRFQNYSVNPREFMEMGAERPFP